MRVTIKRLKERINTINGLTNNKYEIKMFETTGCGVDISINGEWQATNNEKHFTNKEAMNFLDERFGKEIRNIMLGLV